MNEVDATLPQIREHPHQDGVRIVDPIQETQFSLLTPDAVEPRRCPTDRFYFPADTAATLATDTVETPYPVGAWVRDSDGTTLAEVGSDESVSLRDGQYHVDLTTTGIKVQLSVDGVLTVAGVDDRMRVLVADDSRIHVGVRSLHEQPAATVTTTDDPADVMTAVSTLGSALKTTSCERSFPTLRGHPPLVERGEELAVPEEVTLPSTGVTIEVPQSFEYIYPVAPLAYYLGATVEPGTHPRIVTDDWAYGLGTDSFETAVERVLKQVFLLDCVTRTEGYYQIDLHERRAVETAVDLDFAALYDRSLASQTEAYLEVPYDALTDAMPAWKLTADVRPTAEHVSALPFLANELAVVRCPTTAPGTGEDEVADLAASIFQSEPAEPVRGGATRSTRTHSTAAGEEPLVHPDEADSIEHAYVGEGIPVNASKMTTDAYFRRLAYEPSSDPQISVIVVCNDDEMGAENVVSDIYGTREWVEFDIEFRENLTTTEMRDTLRTDADFLHYIGHVDTKGIKCADGHLDARDLSDVNVSAFILNACDSYDQGRALVDHGAMAGIVTLREVNIDLATSVGKTIAHLLNQGFSLAATATLVEEYEEVGHHYLVVGDASTAVANTNSGTPHCVEIEQSDGSYLMSMFGYPRLDSPLGSVYTPFVPGESSLYLNSGRMGSYELSAEDLFAFLDQEDPPIIKNSKLRWSGDFLRDD